MTAFIEDIKKVIDMGESLPPDKVVGGLKSVTVLEGKENEFELLFTELAAKVIDHDKECNYYDLYKSRQPRTYLVMEQYEDRDALQNHQQSDYGKNYFSKIRELLEKIDVNYFECITQLKSVWYYIGAKHYKIEIPIVYKKWNGDEEEDLSSPNKGIEGNSLEST